MSKHTPGPWYAEHCKGREGKREDMWQVRGGKGTYTYGVYVASVEDVDSLTWPQAEANARLIAAAPEMYEALKALLTLEELEFGDDSLLPTDHPKSLAEAAIAKAEGRQ